MWPRRAWDPEPRRLSLGLFLLVRRLGRRDLFRRRLLVRRDLFLRGLFRRCLAIGLRLCRAFGLAIRGVLDRCETIGLGLRRRGVERGLRLGDRTTFAIRRGCGY